MIRILDPQGVINMSPVATKKSFPSPKGQREDLKVTMVHVVVVKPFQNISQTRGLKGHFEWNAAKARELEKNSIQFSRCSSCNLSKESYIRLDKHSI